MRIVITRASSAFFLDGVNTFIFELSAALVKKGHEVHIISGCCNYVHQKVSNLFDLDVVPAIHFLKRGHFKNNMEEIINWTIHSRRLINKLEPDAIIMNGVVPCITSHIRISVCHGLKAKGYLPPAQKLYDYIMYRTADSIVAVSEPLKKEIASELGIKNAIVIPIGLNVKNIPQCSYEQRKKAILHVGTNNVKNLPTTLKAFKILLSKMPEVELYIVGKSIDQYRKFITSDMKNKVHFFGFLTRPNLMSLCSNVAVVSAPSLYEAFSYTVLEAFSSATPVVGSSAIPEDLLVDGYNGYRTASPDDYQTLALRLFELLSNDSKWRYMSSNARATALNYDILTVAQAYINLIHELHARF
jgi:glycosyltransferase involved in cell wall biosynthesis